MNFEPFDWILILKLIKKKIMISNKLCTYTTDTQCPPEQPLTDKLALLQIHADSAHATPAPAPRPAPQPRVKLDPPQLSAGSDQETWEHFLRNRSMYKTGWE